ncbi:MAG: hypothetical protein KKD90_05445 [Candidatus Omnitrophica bacterium]|nr:hypothetical protein [Candidatus Omnitrophota bacterium]MBU4149518.1 hypothetical protein [Candidatus Omnitrophota bacterium]
MKKRNIAILTTCMALLFLMSGCATLYEDVYGSGSAEPRPLDVSTLLRFNDVPVPAGYQVLDSESFAFQNDATRVALLKYVGSRTADQVVLFYKDQMPVYNWNPINIIEYERRMLNYEKDAESCIVTVESKGRKSIVIIAISPKSRPMKMDVVK